MQPSRIVLPAVAVVAALALGQTASEQPDGPFPPPPPAAGDAPVDRIVSASSPAPAAEAEPQDDGAYRLDEVVVSLADDVDPDALAADLGARVLHAAPELGLALLEVPADQSRAAFRDALAQDDRVTSAAPNGVVAGAGVGRGDDGNDRQRKSEKNAGSPSGSAGAATAQWYRDYIGLDEALPAMERITVAVLDSGVAFEPAHDGTTAFVVPPSLQDVKFVAPYDFVERDDQPLDEHQHGTHITSIIAGEGAYPGVAPGVAIMPLRVLDERNQGTEYDLIQAISYAVANGADVINMSLAFAPGYVPSPALRKAIDRGASHGVILVGAAGNDARDDIPSWPAASPNVISVGAMSLNDGATTGAEEVAAPYSNLGVGIDIMAPGGDLQADANKDGIPDGIVAEAIAPGDPSRVGAWMYAGSSQAAAVVSGAAAHLLASGVRPESVRLALLEGSRHWGAHSFSNGTGAGSVDIGRALDNDHAPWVVTPARYGATLLPFPTTGTDETGRAFAGASALVSVTVLDGTPSTRYVELYGTAWGPSGAGSWTCKLKVTERTCRIDGESVSIDRPGDDPGAAWAFSVEAVVESGIDVPHRPAAVMFASDAFEVLLTAMADEPAVQGRALAVEWDGEIDPHLGQTAAGYTVMNSGTGLATSPFGVVFTPNAVTRQQQATVDVDLDGTGLATSPMGNFRLSTFSIDGTGLATSPFDFRALHLVAIDGTGLATSPMGNFTARDLYSPMGDAPTLGLGLDGAVMVMGDQELVGAGAGADALSTQSLLDHGGFQAASGFEVADVLAGSGAVEVGLAVESAAVAAGEDRMPLP